MTSAKGTGPRATFTSMERSTEQDWRIIGSQFAAYARALPGRVLDHLKLLDGDFGGFPVDRLTHSLQTATLAHRDGRDEEYVVCALLHDIGDTLGAYNHPDVAAAILKPFVSEANHWMVQHHGIFQGYYFFHHLGWTGTRATPIATIPTSSAPRSSARAMTVPPSTSARRPCRFRSSSRSSSGSLPGP